MHTFTVALWGQAPSVEITLDQLPVIELNGEQLDPRIVRWAIEYGFRQGIRDAGAQGKDDAERNAGALKRVDALVNNTLREGGGGGVKLTPADREAKAIAEREIRAAFDDPRNVAWVAEQRKATGLNLSDLRDKAVKAHLVKHADRLRAEAEKVLAATPSIDIDLTDVA